MFKFKKYISRRVELLDLDLKLLKDSLYLLEIEVKYRNKEKTMSDTKDLRLIAYQEARRRLVEEYHAYRFTPGPIPVEFPTHADVEAEAKLIYECLMLP